ncbi:MAG: RNA 2',3'-cyclic phosphodiesterase [Pseudomonadota bacterium]
MAIRSFIAFPIPRDMANALGDLAAQMAYQDKSNAVRWVDQANYHVTLAFLGEQDERDLEDLAELLDNHLPQTSLSISISHFSPFPESRPKLIAAMLERNDTLLELQRTVNTAVASSAISIDKRRFKPHITLGRFRHSKNHFAGAIPTSINLSANITDVAIYESNLTPSGAEYEPIFRFPLDDYEFEFDEV